LGELDDRLDAWIEDFLAKLRVNAPIVAGRPLSRLSTVQRLLFAEFLAEAIADALAPSLAAELAPRLLRQLEQPPGKGPERGGEAGEGRTRDSRYESGARTRASGATRSGHAAGP
jgi:hypothetical protein